jgi:hypothetical protein
MIDISVFAVPAVWTLILVQGSEAIAPGVRDGHPLANRCPEPHGARTAAGLLALCHPAEQVTAERNDCA